MKGKNVIITGANRGIGKALVKRFAESGCNIWACARRQDDEYKRRLDSLARECNVWIEPVYFDLESEEAIKDGFKQIYRSKKSIDILINNAGIGHAALFQMTPIATARKVFEVDFFATFILTQFVLKVMMRQKQGCIINMASISGLDGNALDVTYGSAKAALIAFTKSLAAEVGKQGIRINAIAPGPTQTDMLNMYQEDIRLYLEQRNALGRFLQPEEISDVVMFLADDASKAINGQVIRVDGGSK